MKNKIAHRLTLYFAFVLLLFALLSGVLFSVMFARHTADVTEKDLRAHAVSIAETMTQFVANYCYGTCEGGGFKAYTRFVGDFAMSDIYLIDPSFSPAGLGEMPLTNKPLPEEARSLVSAVFESGAVVTSKKSVFPLHQDSLFAAAPVFNPQGGVQYALLLHSSVGSTEHAMHDTVCILAVCLSAAMVLAIAVSLLLSKRFVTPLQKMREATTRMMNGDYTAKTGVLQNDEIGTLANHIDALSDQLAVIEVERRQLDQMRQDFFSDISHELRTPIAVLKGSVELLRNDIITDPQRREAYYDQLYEDAVHLERMINDLLELTRLQNPKFKIEMSVVNLLDILRDSVRFMTQRAQEKHIAIELDDEAGAFPVLCDYTRLRQLMIILLDNAIKFSPEHSAIQLIVRRTQEGCTVDVCDHGCGIDEESLAHIFDRFFHTRSSLNRSGTGLGLPIAKEIALRHGIGLSCQSAPGEGTCFRLVFPACEIPQE